ncbi:MAG: hypothetical protein MHM6MM_009466, partial [Cercozoa sp. M6MM]
MFSATFPRSIERLARGALSRPVQVMIGSRSAASGQVEQHVLVLKESDKVPRLLQLLEKFSVPAGQPARGHRGQVLIFAHERGTVDSLFTTLSQHGYLSLALHSGMAQSDRDYTIMDFRNRTRSVLIATSVASRGLDVKDIKCVINYDVPTHYEDYVHRVGRTGRANTRGTAFTFITPSQERYAHLLVKALTLAKQTKRILPALKKMEESFAAKIKAGTEKVYGNAGYDTAGFQFDAKEADAVLARKKAQAE